MPILKEYVNDDGYYINARPSDVGNVTYQVDSRLWGFLEELGYHHESEIEWSLVKSFRLAGLIYTEGSGVDDDIDEDIPELDPSKLSQLSEPDIQELLDYIDSRDDLNPELKKEIRNYILDNTEEAQADIEEDLRETIKNTLISEGLNTWSFEVSVSEGIEQHWMVTDITIKLQQFTIQPTRSTTSITHAFTNMEPVDEGVDDFATRWSVESEDSISWETTLDALQQKAVLARTVVEFLQDRGHEFNNPEDSLGGDDQGFIQIQR